MSKGFQSDPAEYINTIKQNLADRYHDGFSILKELVQNADDAGATQVDIAWIPGRMGPNLHPLMGGPAVLVLNNGRFTKSDEESIRHMGLNDKQAEKASIGKFGLGLKSIFHWCEAFFYAAHTADERQIADILNPWSGERRSYHPEWDEFSADMAGQLENAIKQLSKEYPWFALWIPLRRHSHVGAMPPIQAEYGGDVGQPPAWLTDSELARRFAELFPLLLHITAVRVWLPSGNGSMQLRSISELYPAPERRHYLREDITSEAIWPLRGSVTTGGVLRHPFVGQEAIVNDPLLRNLKASGRWPQSIALSGPLKEKADQHGAVVFMAHPARSHPTLTISWGVFLPLGEEAVDSVNLVEPVDRDFFLLLHGDFFVDPGRNRPLLSTFYVTPDGLPTSDAQLREQWNHQLAAQGVFPQLLPALNRFCVEAGLSNAEVFALTKGLSRSSLIVQWRDAAYRDHQWAYSISPDGGSWQLLAAHETILTVPDPTATGIVPTSILVGIGTASERWHISYVGWPRLAITSTAAAWPPEALTHVFQGGLDSAFANEVTIDYLARFLAGTGHNLQHPAVQTEMVRALRSGFLRADLFKLRDCKEIVADIVEVLGPTKTLVLPFLPSPEGDSAFRHLLSLDLPFLLIPDYLCRESLSRRADTGIGLEDAVTMLQHVSTLKIEGADSLTSELAVGILASLDWNERRLAVDGCRSLKLFSGYGSQIKEERLLSWDELGQLHRDHMLLQSDVSSDWGIVHDLQEAVGKGDLFVLSADMTSLLFEAGTLPKVNEEGAARALLALALYGDPAARLPLLNRMLKAANVPATAIRYLLHAQPAYRYEVEAVLLAESTQSVAQVWSTLTAQALAKLDGGEWRQISGLLSESISRNLWEALGLAEIGPQASEELIKEAGPANIECGGLTDSDREQVLLAFRDTEVLRGLRIHPDLTGTLRVIGEDCYFESADFRVDPAFLSLVTVLRRSKNPKVAAVQTSPTDSSALASAWSERVAIDLALKQSQPHAFALPIIDALRRQGWAELYQERQARLRAGRWLPGRLGDRAYRPDDVLHIKGMEGEIERIVSESGGVAASLNDLSEGVLGYNGFDVVLRECLPKEDKVLELLAEIIADNDSLAAYRLGERLNSIDSLRDFCQAFESAPAILMPSASLLRKAAQVIGENGENSCLQHLAPRLTAELRPERLVELLNWLSGQHEHASQTGKALYRRVHDSYLRALAASASQSCPPDLRLLSQREQWRMVSDLCSPEANVDKMYLANREQCVIIQRLLHSGVVEAMETDGSSLPPPDYDSDLEASAGRLRKYFEEWESNCPGPVIAGFLSILGDHPQILALATRYFERQGSVETFRARLEWQGNSEAQIWRQQTISGVMASQFVLVSIIDPRQGQALQAPNLLGTLIDVTPPEEPEHLLGGNRLPTHPANSPDKPRRLPLTLRSIDPTQYSEPELAGILRKTAAQILKQVYFQDVPNLGEIWEKLREREQLDIRVAQIRILDALFVVARSLGVQSHFEVGEVLRKWDEADRLRADVEDLTQPEGARIRSQSERTLREARDNLQRLLEANDSVQGLFLEGVRRRLRQYQYNEESIPFELFQNADDAVLERQQMLEGEEVPLHQRRFGLVIGNAFLQFFHWGRPINRYKVGDVGDRSNGYDGDLEKMLLLGGSDKGMDQNGPAVTGRFGLGFKSVLLFTDRPEVVSGGLTFDIVGGLYPRRLLGEDRQRLDSIFTDNGLDRAGGTLFHLEASPSKDPSAVVERFNRLAPMLLVFSKVIKECLLVDTKGAKHTVNWEEQPVRGTLGVSQGNLEAAEWGGSTMVLRCDRGALLLRLGPNGFRALPADVPSVWVTAPTTHVENLGFAINAPFDVDVGRSQLAGDSRHNRELATLLGSQLAEPFRSLARQAMHDWDGLRQDLGLSVNTTPYEFWYSLWERLGASLVGRDDSSIAVKLVRQIFWGTSDCAMPSLLSHHRVIPSGLTGLYECLVQLDDSHYHTQGALATRPGLFDLVAAWDSFQAEFPKGAMLSGDVNRALSDLLPDQFSTTGVSLRNAISAELKGGWDVDLDAATRLGKVVTVPLLAGLQNGDNASVAEYQDLLSLVRQLRYRAKDGTFREASGLLTVSSPAGEDEEKRAAFAPTPRLLDSSYQGDALRFFLVCRPRMEANADTLAQWMLDATNGPARLAALDYLASGDLSTEVAERLRTRSGGSWLGNLVESQLLKQLDQWDQNLVLVRLHQLPQATSAPPPPPPPTLSAKQALEAVYEWWLGSGAKEWRVRYAEQTFPSGRQLRPAELTSSTASNRGLFDRLRGSQPVTPSTEQLEARKEWLKLLLLGATFALGGLRSDQHRSFIETCEERGWLDKFAAAKPNLGEFAGDLLNYLDKEVGTPPFYYWMRLFVPLYQFSWWLDEYASLFFEFNKLDQQWPLNQLLSSNQLPALTGSGLRAPSLRGALGALGGSFVLRELMRSRVLSNPTLHPHCYVPSRSVRRLLAGLGCSSLDSDWPKPEMSNEIHRFLMEHLGQARALFDGDFDIPLLVIAGNPILQRQLLHSTLPADDGSDPDEGILGIN